MMDAPLTVHGAAGLLAIGAGYVALYAGKGQRTHRAAGMVFAVTMLVMLFSGLVMTLARDIAVATNAPAAVLTAYLVITSLMAIRPPARGARWLLAGLAAVAGVTGTVALRFGIEALATGSGMAFPFFLFAALGLGGAAGDIQVLRAGPPAGTRRLVRHLWRMCFALFVAALSLFLGQADLFPEALRKSGLMPLPPLAVIVTLVYWLWRVRYRAACSAFGLVVGVRSGPGRAAK